MNILVNGITVNVTNAYAERENGIIICTVIVPQSEMEYADVKALFKENTGDIVYTNDDGQKIFSGFSFSSILDDNENYIVKLTADEYAFQLGRNRELEADKATLESTVASKENEIFTLNSTISEKEQTIAERDETITAKDTVIGQKEVVITEQAETIATLETTIATKDEELTAKDSEIAELLTIAEEYADMVFASLEESEVM